MLAAYAGNEAVARILAGAIKKAGANKNVKMEVRQEFVGLVHLGAKQCVLVCVSGKWGGVRQATVRSLLTWCVEVLLAVARTGP